MLHIKSRTRRSTEESEELIVLLNVTRQIPLLHSSQLFSMASLRQPWVMQALHLIRLAKPWRARSYVINRKLSSLCQLVSLCPSLLPPLSYSSEEKHVFVTQRWRSCCLVLLLMTYPAGLLWIMSIQKKKTKNPGSHKYKNCRESPTMMRTNAEKKPKKTLRHMAPPWQNGTASSLWQNHFICRYCAREFFWFNTPR